MIRVDRVPISASAAIPARSTAAASAEPPPRPAPCGTLLESQTRMASGRPASSWSALAARSVRLPSPPGTPAAAGPSTFNVWRDGVSGLDAEPDEVVPVDRDKDAVDVVPPVRATGDDLEREIELCVCGDDPRGKSRHGR